MSGTGPPGTPACRAPSRASRSPTHVHARRLRGAVAGYSSGGERRRPRARPLISILSPMHPHHRVLFRAGLTGHLSVRAYHQLLKSAALVSEVALTASSYQSAAGRSLAGVVFGSAVGGPGTSPPPDRQSFGHRTAWSGQRSSTATQTRAVRGSGRRSLFATRGSEAWCCEATGECRALRC